MDLPRLKANFAVEVVDGEKVFLLAEDQHILVQGRGPAAVVPYLDGQHTIAQIAQLVGSKLSLAATLAAIGKFDAFGQLADGLPDLPRAQLAYWDALGVDPAAAAARLRQSAVRVVAPDNRVTRTVISALNGDEIPAIVSDIDEAIATDSAIVVVLTEDYLHPDLSRLDAALAGTGRRWLPAKPSGRVLWLGPLIEHGRTGCWACLAQRLEANRQVERYIHGKVKASRARSAPGAAAANLAAGPSVLAGLLAGELALILATGTSPNLDGQMVTLDLQALTTTAHVLVRRPQCPRCGDRELTASRDPKVGIASRPALRDPDGGLRARPSGEVFEDLRRHVSPFLGAVTSLVCGVEVENGLTYTYTAGHNFAMVGDNMRMLRRNLRGQSGGKGRTDLQARLSALGEAIERYSGVWRGTEPVRHAAFAGLDPGEAIHPESLLMFSDRQYAGRQAWNADPAHRLHMVPERMAPDVPIDWTAGWSLTRERVRLVPSAYAWYGHPDLERHFYCFADSNGNAAGTNREEAIVQGFCELVERDAVAIWWYNRVRRPAVDLDGLADPYVDRLRDWYAQSGRDLWVLDITTDLGIPVFAAVSPRKDHPTQDILVGFGAHLSARVAIARALTEVNQFLPAVTARDQAGSTIYREDDVATLAWWHEARIEDEPWLCPAVRQPARRVDSYPDAGIDDLGTAAQHCVERARAAGLEVIVVDQTQPDLDLCVVKVIVPGLRHFWRRLGAGRLYTAPVSLGWLDREPTEDEVNPRNVFF